MRELKFQFIYKCISFPCGDELVTWHKKAYSLDTLINERVPEICDLHNTCELVARREHTGLKDKNGNGENELCQDDIVNVFGLGPCRVDKNYWGAWCVIDHSGYECPIHDAVMEQDLGELLGNIHENPDLLGDNNEN